MRSRSATDGLGLTSGASSSKGEIAVEIYLLRHGDAEEAEPGQNDAGRKLTKKGRKQAKRAAKWFDNNDVELGVIISSPLVRARKTAQQIAKRLDMQIVTDTRLSGGTLTIDTLADLAEELGNPDSMLIVGHEPDFSYIIGQLTDGHVDMKKAAIAMVECEAIAVREGQIAMLIPPAMQ